MMCPNCAAEIVDKTVICPSCGVFPEKFEKRNEERERQERINRLVGDGPVVVAPIPWWKRLVRVRLVVALAFLAWTLWLWPKVMVTAPLPLIEGSHENKTQHFALMAPRGWVRYRPDDFQQQLSAHRVPSRAYDLIGLVPKGSLADGWVLGDTSDLFPPVFQVQVVRGLLDLWVEKNPNVTLFAMNTSLLALLRGVEQDGRQVRRVDRLGAVEVRGRGKLVVDVAAGERLVADPFAKGGRYREVPVSWIHVLVPGQERTYVLTGFAMQETWSEHAPAFEGAVNSFRVLGERPPAYGPLLTAFVRVGMVLLIMLAGVNVLRSR